MTSEHAHAFLSVIAPSTVPEYTPSYDTHVDLVRSVQLPDALAVIPAAVSREAASGWLSCTPERDSTAPASVGAADTQAARSAMVVVIS